MVVSSLIDMLRTEKQVYVNQLGLFSKEFHPAKVGKTSIMPPHYSVVLDSQAEGSGFNFTLHHSNRQKIKIVDADIAISHWTEELLEQLRREKRVAVPGFGVFTLKKGILGFESEIIPALNAEFEGMEEIALKEEPAAEQPSAPEVPLVAAVPVAAETPAVPEVVEEQPAAPEIPETPAEPEVVEIPAVEEEPVTPEVVEQPAEPEIPETPAEPEAVEEPVEEIPAVEEAPVATEEVEQTVVNEEPAVPEEVEQTVVNEVPAVPEEVEQTVVNEEPVGSEEVEQTVVSEEPAAPEEIEQTVVNEKPAASEEVEQTVVNEDTEIPEQVDEQTGRKRSRWWLWLLIVLFILAAAGTAGYFYRAQISDFVHPYLEKWGWVKSEQPAPQPAENPQPVSELNDTQNESVAETDTLLQESDTLSEQIEEPQPEPVPVSVQKTFDSNNMRHITFETGKFYVIHGSFGCDSDCAKHVCQACLQKYNPSILCTPGDWHRRVCLGVFSTEAEAESFAAGIKKAWVKSE